MFNRWYRNPILNAGLRVKPRQASFQRKPKRPYLVSVHGPDRPGIVSRVTGLLAKHRFNITDLSTHRTTSGTTPGYILFIEGEAGNEASIRAIRVELNRLQRLLKTKVDLRAVQSEPL